MCNKRVSIEYAVKMDVLPINYLLYYGELAKSYTVTVFEKDGQYFIEDPKTHNWVQISEEMYRTINEYGKKPNRSRRKK